MGWKYKAISMDFGVMHLFQPICEFSRINYVGKKCPGLHLLPCLGAVVALVCCGMWDACAAYRLGQKMSSCCSRQSKKYSRSFFYFLFSEETLNPYIHLDKAGKLLGSKSAPCRWYHKEMHVMKNP